MHLVGLILADHRSIFCQLRIGDDADVPIVLARRDRPEKSLLIRMVAVLSTSSTCLALMVENTPPICWHTANTATPSRG